MMSCSSSDEKSDSKRCQMVDESVELSISVTQHQLHLFQQALFVKEPSIAYADAEWRTLCAALRVLVNAITSSPETAKTAKFVCFYDSCCPTAEAESEFGIHGLARNPDVHGGTASIDFGGLCSSEGSSKSHKPWKLYSNPESLTIKRKSLISSKIGKLLETRGVMGLTLFILANACVLLWFVAPIIHLESSGVLVDGSPSYTLKRCGLLVFLLHLALRYLLTFFAAHRINRQMFVASLFYFETVVCTGALLVGQVAWILHCNFLANDTYSIQARLEDFVLLISTLPIFLCISASDSFRFKQRAKVMSLATVCIYLAWTWLHTRCLSDRWGEAVNCQIMGESGLSLREVTLVTLIQSFVFFLQGLMKQLSGDMFAVIHPVFCSSLSVSSCESLSRFESDNHHTYSVCRIHIGSATIKALAALQSHVQPVLQSTEMREVFSQLRPLLVHALESAWDLSLAKQTSALGTSDLVSLHAGLPMVSQDANDLEWHLCSEPAVLELSRTMVLTSSIGMRLHESGCIGILTLLFGALIILLINVAPWTKLVHGDVTYTIWPVPVWCGMFFLVIGLCLLLEHSMNRALVKLALYRFETIFLMLSSFIRAGTTMYQVIKVFDFNLDATMGTVLGDGVLSLAFAVHVNVIDSWRFQRKYRRFIYFAAALFYLNQYHINRCSRDFWREPTDCSLTWDRLDGIRLREIYLSSSLSCLIFFAKALCRHLQGNVLGVCHPRYVPASAMVISNGARPFPYLESGEGKCTEDGQVAKPLPDSPPEALQSQDSDVTPERILDAHHVEQRLDTARLDLKQQGHSKFSL